MTIEPENINKKGACRHNHKQTGRKAKKWEAKSQQKQQQPKKHAKK